MRTSIQRKHETRSAGAVGPPAKQRKRSQRRLAGRLLLDTLADVAPDIVDCLLGGAAKQAGRDELQETGEARDRRLPLDARAVLEARQPEGRFDLGAAADRLVRQMKAHGG